MIDDKALLLALAGISLIGLAIALFLLTIPV